MVKAVVFVRFGRMLTILMEILSFGVQATGLDPGVGEMFRFVAPNPGNRASFVRIAIPPSQVCKESPLACN